MAAGRTIEGLTGCKVPALTNVNVIMLHLPAKDRLRLGLPSMRWFRSRRQFGGWIALFALLLQLGLSFGHVHGTAPDRPAALTAAAPSTDTGDRGEADHCATCAILTLLAGAQTENAPVFALPFVLAAAEITFAPETVRISQPRAAFRSRAPPLS